MGRRRILIIDDDKDLTFIIRKLLEDHDYEVSVAEDSNQAFACLSKESFQLILLDINLPDAIGFEICAELRKTTNVPILFASARTSEDDRVTGFTIGGDDYLPKPYSMKELLARVNALMRRAYGDKTEPEITFGEIAVNPVTREVTKRGQTVSLALREFDLLYFLCRNANKMIEKDKLISEVWGAFSEVEPSTLTVHMRWLREKLEDDPSNPKYLKTVWGKGYLLEIR